MKKELLATYYYKNKDYNIFECIVEDVMFYCIYTDGKLVMSGERCTFSVFPTRKNVIHFVDTSKREISELDIKVTDLGMSTRTLNVLKACDIETVDELVQYSERDLRCFRNLGKKSIAEIKGFVSLFDLEMSKIDKLK